MGWFDDIIDAITKPVEEVVQTVRDVIIPKPPPAPDFSGISRAMDDAARRQAEAMAAIAEQQAAMIESQRAMVRQQQEALAEEKAKAEAELAEQEARKKKRLDLAAKGPETLLTGGRGATGTPSLLKPALGGRL